MILINKFIIKYFIIYIMRTYKKRSFRKGRKTRRGGTSSSKKSSGNKGIEMKTFRRSGEGLKRMTRDKFKRAAKNASNVRFLKKEATRAHDRQLDEAREAYYRQLVHEGRL